jgi:hypothetical protein
MKPECARHNRLIASVLHKTTNQKYFLKIGDDVTVDDMRDGSC